MSNKIAVMQTPKRMCIKGRMQTVFLTDYDSSNDTYFGEAHSNRSLEVGQEVPLITPVIGARPYPYASRPNYAFQFVEMGEDEQPLLDIAAGNVRQAGEAATTDAGDADKSNADVTEQGSFDPADLNRDGVVTSRERKQFDRSR